jgi:hypothetical protein
MSRSSTQQILLELEYHNALGRSTSALTQTISQHSSWYLDAISSARRSRGRRRSTSEVVTPDFHLGGQGTKLSWQTRQYRRSLTRRTPQGCSRRFATGQFADRKAIQTRWAKCSQLCGLDPGRALRNAAVVGLQETPVFNSAFRKLRIEIIVVFGGPHRCPRVSLDGIHRVPGAVAVQALHNIGENQPMTVAIRCRASIETRQSTVESLCHSAKARCRV